MLFSNYILQQKKKKRTVFSKSERKDGGRKTGVNKNKLTREWKAKQGNELKTVLPHRFQG